MGVSQYLTWGEPKFCTKPSFKYLRQFTPGDLNSFFMLFFGNFSSLLGIIAATLGAPMIACSFDFTYAPYFQAFTDMVFQRVCPGIGCSIIFGNVWYAIMAAKISEREGRMNVTALPYGVNTPAGFLTVFMVLLPICFKYSPKILIEVVGVPALDPEDFAWTVFTAGCSANLIGGAFVVVGFWFGKVLRKNVPRAALFGPITGIGFVWLGLNPLIDIMREPLIGLLPLALCFTGFFAGNGKGIYPNKVPAAFLIFVVGTTLWWCGLARWDTESRSGDFADTPGSELSALLGTENSVLFGTGDMNENQKMAAQVRFAWNQYAGKNRFAPFVALSGFSELTTRAVAIQFPIALASFLETVENVESAYLSGDDYNVNEALLADGLGTMFGALCGSVYPTTVFIGHRRHKMTGATSGYSLLNGIVYFVLMMSGLTGVIFYIIDPVSISVILIAVGLMISQQAFENVAARHYPPLFVAMMFAVSEIIYFDQFDSHVGMATRSLGRMRGVANMAPGGGIICAIVVPAILCDLIDSRFIRASIFSAVACLFSLFGIMHGNNYVFFNGHMMSAMSGVGGDFYTTDLGEVMLSTFVAPTTNSRGFPLDPPVEVAYHMNNDEIHPFNEGWRFAVAYSALVLFCLAHAAVQKMRPGSMPAVMDNGVVQRKAPAAMVHDKIEAGSA